MSLPVLAALAAAATLLAIIWWPTTAATPASLIAGNLILAERRSVQAGPLLAVAAVIGGFATGTALFGAVTGVASMILSGVCVWAVAIQVRSRRSMREADDLAQLAGSLANQALVAPTVIEAIRQAAPLIGGRVGTAAQQMAAECETGGLIEAASRFASTVQRPIAEMLSTVLAEAFRGGSQWVGLAGVLADEAAEAAETARHFHRYVAALMPQVSVTVMMSVGMLAITGFAAKDVGRWLTSAVGQNFLAVSALLTAALCARVLAPAWRSSR